MTHAAARPTAVSRFKDQVLFLKHNLDAQAIPWLKGDLKSVESDIEALIREMNVSIAEAERFVQAMSGA
jgi:hypothetical protein